MTEERWEEGGAWKNLRNRWLGSHATQDESKREEGSSFEATLWRNGDYASNGGGGVSSIISLRRQARIFIDYTSHPLKTASLIGKRTTVDEERKREREREKGRRGHDIWHGSTWLVSHLLTIFVLTVFVEGTYLYVGPWTYFLYTYSCIISVYTFPHSSAGEHYHCRNVSLLFFIFLVLSPHCSCNES